MNLTERAIRRRILVVVAHADDETLGIGGTIARHLEAGDAVTCMVMTDGVGARQASAGKSVNLRHRNAQLVAEILGFEWRAAGTFPDNAMDSVPLLEVVRFVEAAKRDLSPDLVYTHHANDLNVDHQITHRAVLTAFRPQPAETCSEIRCFEVPSATDYVPASAASAFLPNLYIDIGGSWNKKLAALTAYGDEMRPSPHSRSIEGVRALAVLRGHQVGLTMAEALVVVRRLIR